jgi:hypothetical protein
LPSPEFFGFCEELLNYYQEDGRVWVVTGNNFQNGRKRGEAAYYFSRYNHAWGWATWRRAWQKSDMKLSFWPKWKESSSWKSHWSVSITRSYWEEIFDRMYRAEIDTWDYPWTASVWYHGGLTATPNANLVTNIGFGKDSTHTKWESSPLAGLPYTSLGQLTHPSEILADHPADQYVFESVFMAENRRKWSRKLSLLFPRSWKILIRILRGHRA